VSVYVMSIRLGRHNARAISGVRPRRCEALFHYTTTVAEDKRSKKQAASASILVGCRTLGLSRGTVP
jgi:hypothetical protein